MDPLRRAALEGLAVGLSVWPQAALQQLLLELCNDLDGPLASQAVELLARLPSAREGLEQVLGRPLDPVTEARARRRLASLPRCPLKQSNLSDKSPSARIKPSIAPGWRASISLSKKIRTQST